MTVFVLSYYNGVKFLFYVKLESNEIAIFFKKVLFLINWSLNFGLFLELLGDSFLSFSAYRFSYIFSNFFQLKLILLFGFYPVNYSYKDFDFGSSKIILSTSNFSIF